ncbi:unnamed protein product, partial [Rotaria sp. Silwood1]
MGSVYLVIDDNSKALLLYQKALEIQHKNLTPDDP